MASNREKKVYLDAVHILMGLKRPSKGQPKSDCIRQVVKDFDLDLKILEAKLKAMGGEWRIYKTVNARNVEKARIWLLHKLIDFPEAAANADSEWRTALLQTECKVTDFFMLDIDTEEESTINQIETFISMFKVEVLNRIKSPKGWHYITKKFDTREVIKLGNVTLLRDGYHYVKTVKGE